ncbi:DinB family protein [Tessaracoccus antarcticus]|uniref:DinB family protein n=2 Tax=Tessaracoccus antarcticus TaxID=2479848 RepID=A0A3M0GGR3_9ACTN|nr:DinB family protein [Tessaracoccus antarcticus]
MLIDAFERVQELVPGVVEDLSVQDLLWRPDADANPVGWLVWHLARVQDDHLAGISDGEQVWVQDGWERRFALPYDTHSIGYGQTSREVGDFSVDSPGLLTGYYAAVCERTADILRAMSPKDLDRVIDESYDPPVTVATRLVSVINDTTQHIGQAGYVRGLVERRRRS